MQILITTNLRDVIEDFDRIPENINEAVLDALNTGINVGFQYASAITQERLPSGGGSYLASFGIEGARRTGNDWVANLYNDHEFAIAVENGGGPIVPHAPQFVIPPGKSPYMTTRRFSRRKPPRAFNIFRDTGLYLLNRFPKILSQKLNQHLFR